MTPETKVRLLSSMGSGRLVLVCGAGLSMAPPSSLPAAREIAECCFDQHQLTSDPDLNPNLRHDLPALAAHFLALGTLKTVFVDHLVPWATFLRPPNAGHAAIADFLITQAAGAALSSNYDTLIEQSAIAYRFNFQASLDGDEAGIHGQKHGPLIKFHGCLNRDRPYTIWAQGQFEEEPVATRLQNIRIWMTANLRQRDFLIVGFWSDWHYLNQILSLALQETHPVSVTLVDRASEADLQQKAPELWTLSHATNVHFEHVRESADTVLNDLRCAFSVGYLRQVLAAGRTTLEAQSGEQFDPTWLDIADFDAETLYDWRRDAEGIPRSEAATRRCPENAEVIGFTHLLLRKAGAQQSPEGYSMNGCTVRVINGAGHFLSTVRARFTGAPTIQGPDVVVAAGATDAGLPENVVRDGRAGDFMRPQDPSVWYDLEGARQELQI